MKFDINKLTNTLKFNSKTSVMVLGALTAITMIGLIADNIFVTEKMREDQYRNYLLEETLANGLAIFKHVSEAVDGKEEAFDRTSKEIKSFEKHIGQVINGREDRGVSPLSDKYLGLAKDVKTKWIPFREQAKIISQSSEAILTIRGSEEQVSKILPEFKENSEALANKLIKAKAQPEQVQLATRLKLLSERITTDTLKTVTTSFHSVETLDKALKDLNNNFRDGANITKVLLDGDRKAGVTAVSDARLRKTLGLMKTELVALDELYTSRQVEFDDMLVAQSAAIYIRDNIDILLSSLDKLEAAYKADANPYWAYADLEDYFAIAAFVFISLFAIAWYTYNRDLLTETEKRRQEQEQQNARNQEAILQLLDEISGLADGDLSENATVSEDITGAIADAFNYAIDAMRDVVGRINTTTGQVTQAANDTQTEALALTEASNQQADAIGKATQSISQMAEAASSISDSAKKSAKAAIDSVGFAKKGAVAVRHNVSGMDTIREQIQDTSKRIKRLGESSQEIGEIVELINEIAEQTNLLALNAAIQAAMAGEAGRGFAVVADEVQRLAERSGGATKQIETLVQTIQADTNEAMRSMEKSTSEVVSGTRIAQEAGSALEEIEKVSVELAEKINVISDSSQEQAEAATAVNNTMQVIEKITAQTLDGTNKAADSVGKLAVLGNDLRNSVAGFKMPED